MVFVLISLRVKLRFSCARFFQRRGFVGSFPGDLGIVFAEVSVVGGLAVNRAEQIELLNDVGGLEGEDCD